MQPQINEACFEYVPIELQAVKLLAPGWSQSKLILLFHFQFSLQ